MGRHRLDGNHKAVRKAVEALGYLWLDTSQTDIGLDAILVKHGRIIPAEVKDGTLSPSRQRLTPNEAKVHQALKQHGVTVEILTGVDSSLDVLKQPFRNMYDKNV